MSSTSLPTHPLFKNLLGKTFGSLTVVEFVRDAKSNAQKKTKWKCQCSCGNKIIAFATHLIRGNTNSCGCTRFDTHVTHGLSDSPEYEAYTSMVQRCTNPKNPKFPDYGQRGITVCDEWLKSPSSFLSYVGLRPSPQHSIDRYPDNNGNYEPGNVRWATRKEQQANRRNTIVLTINGVTKSLVEWSEITGVSQSTIYNRRLSGASDADCIKPASR